MTLPALKTSIHHFPKAEIGPARRTLSQILVDSGKVSADDMFKAITLQNHENARLSELLHALGYATEGAILKAASEEYSLPIIDLEEDPPNSALSQLIHPTLGIRHRFVVWKQVDSVVIVAISDPEDLELVRGKLANVIPDCKFVLASKRAILKYYQKAHVKQLSEAANTHVPARLSCRAWVGHKPKVIGGFLALCLATLCLYAPSHMIFFAFLWVFGSLVANSGYKIFMLVCSIKQPNEDIIKSRPDKLPKISILLPLLKEEDIVDRLIQRMSALIYPKELLEICLIYEESDEATKRHLATKRLPYWMRTIEVPADTLQTKPRAMNYALDFCSGDIVGIYDAEDAPEPEQLFQVVKKFEGADANVACVQCQLDYYNSETNWISRCFSIEYAILFRVILPSLARKNLPVPLGGTSVFFRRSALEDLGRWDAQNVTEDADLGIRLYRKGYRCVWSSATTYEEANFRILPWMRQRSRWLKGFLQTWITHMRHPAQTFRELGWAGFLIFQIQMLGTFSSFAAVPLVVPMWLLSFGFSIPIYNSIPTLMFQILVVCFVFTEFLLLALGFVAVKKRGGKHLLRYVPLMLLYWPLGAFAAYKALWELFVCPHYWDKTAHGINDTDYQSEIDRLTCSPVPRENAKSLSGLTSIGG